MTDPAAPAAADAPLWTPDPERIARARITAFTDWLARTRGLRFERYEDLWQWSVTDLEAFWRAVWDWFEIRADRAPARMLTADRMPGARWCPDVRLNLVDQVLRHDGLSGPALLWESEALGEGAVDWPTLRRDVGAFAASLRALGVQPGDRVVAWLPNLPHTVIAFLAVASIGAVWSVCSPDMGPVAVGDRFTQIAPKVLIACDGYRFGGRAHDRREPLAQIVARLPSLEALVWLPVLDPGAAPPAFDAPDGAGPRALRTLGWGEAVREPASLAPVPMPFDAPLWIVYSSGTTGLPKSIVHGHGGILLAGLVTTVLHTDLGPGHRFFWMSSTGWIVWNLQLLGLLAGATACLYDGAAGGPRANLPAEAGGAPDWAFLWRFAAKHRVRTMGAGAAFFASGLKAGLVPREACDLSALEAIQSSGSPLAPECFAWIYNAVKRDVWLASVSGGTDISGGFMVGLPTLPVYAGELQCRNLGCAVHAFDDAGRALVGAVGELVCTRPVPSMPLFFWNDADGARYRESYFDLFDDPVTGPVWRHGDWLRLVPRPQATGGILYGRSDATINRAGIRMGTSEFYRVVEAQPEILDSLVVDLEYLGRPSCLLLFVVLRPGTPDDAALRQRLAQAIRAGLSARHVPDEVHVVAAIPRTLTGKKLELPVKKLLLGHPPERVFKRDGIAPVEAIDAFVAFAARAGGANG